MRRFLGGRRSLASLCAALVGAFVLLVVAASPALAGDTRDFVVDTRPEYSPEEIKLGALDGYFTGAVFAAKDDDSAKTIEARLNDFLSYRRQEMRDYLPEQYAVLQRAVLRRDGLNVALLVTKDIDKLGQAYQAALHR